MFCQDIFITKALQTVLAKVSFVSAFCFVKHKSVKIFHVHIIRFIIINYEQQIHRVFKFLIWNVSWKRQPIFLTKYVNTNIVSCFNLAKIFLFYRKIIIIIIKLFNKFFIFFWDSFSAYFYTINMPMWHHKKHFWSLFLMLISPFFGLLNSAGNFP